MLHAFVLRSPHAHANIISIDTSSAAKMPGVRALVTGDDFPDLSEPANGRKVDIETVNLSKNIIARDKVL